jgi:cellulose synthase/poly-beta-1,6-N-acetylglucosamine synthase-like glycosyltransferase
MINSYNENDERFKIKYLPVQLTKGGCPDDHQSFYKQQHRWATGSMQLLASDKTVFSNKLSNMQRLIYGSNSLYYFFTIVLLFSPLYLLTLVLSTVPSSWAFTLYFIPALTVRYAIEPFLLRRPLAPLATTIVVISNAYTFLQAVILLLIKKPLGWEATGSKAGKKRSMHFFMFEIGATTAFIFIYLLTLFILIINEQFAFGSSIFVIGLFLTSFIGHIAFLFYTLIVGANGNGKLHKDYKPYVAFILSALIIVVVMQGLKYQTEFDIEYRNNSISLVEQRIDKDSDSLIDGYRRTLGDIKELIGIN